MAVGAPIVCGSRVGFTPRGGALRAAAVASLPSPRLAPRSKIVPSSEERTWLDAVERKKRERQAQRKEEERKAAATLEATEADLMERQRQEEARQRHAEEWQQRRNARIEAKEAQRRAEAERVVQRQAEQAASWVEAVARKKQEERERKRMCHEEALIRAEDARKAEVAAAMEAELQRQIEHAASLRFAEAEEARLMALEDDAAARCREVEHEAFELDCMAKADTESKLAACAAEAAAWDAQVQKTKAAARRVLEAEKREQAAMAFEDAASADMRAIGLREAAIAAAAALEAEIQAKAEALQMAKDAEMRAEKERALLQYNQSQMLAEDAQSASREDHDKRAVERCAWESAVSKRKQQERALRSAEAEELQRMVSEDALSSAMRHQIQRLDADRLAAEAIISEAARLAEAEIAARESAAAAARRACQEAYAVAQKEKTRLDVQRAARECALAHAEDLAAGARRARAMEEIRQREECDRESLAMAAEDKAARRHTRALRGWQREQDRMFDALKADNLRRARQIAQEQAGKERRCCEEAAQQERRAAEAEARAAAERRAAGEAARAATERQLFEASALAAKREQDEARRRQAILEEDRRTFEEQYKRKRHAINELRRREAGKHLSSDADPVSASARTRTPAAAANAAGVPHHGSERLVREPSDATTAVRSMGRPSSGNPVVATTPVETRSAETTLFATPSMATWTASKTSSGGQHGVTKKTFVPTLVESRSLNVTQILEMANALSARSTEGTAPLSNLDGNTFFTTED